MNRNGTILLVEIPTICFAKVVIPVAYISPSGLIVTPAPTIMSSLNVAIPATSKIPVLTFAVPIPVSAEPSPSYFVAVMTPV